MPDDLYSVTRPAGFRAGGLACGIKKSGRPDLAMIVSDGPARLGAVFTRNAVVGAPVIVGRRRARRASGRAIVCNSGVANVATGHRGLDDAEAMCLAAATAIDAKASDVLPCSTGVIGQPLPIEAIRRGIGQLAPQLAAGPDADAATARAILTTDLVPKAAWRTVKLGRTDVTLGGIAKGSGMIAPNMATMLGFITTDAAIAPAMLRRALREAVNADASFNRISVDSDTSTSDTVAVLANGAAGGAAIASAGRHFARFGDALADLCRDLAYQVIADGEGAEHVIRVTVTGARSDRDALRAARSVADSPLVKTAVHGGDPNWGRLVMAVGKSAAKVDPARLSVSIGGARVFHAGEPTDFDPAAVSRAMGGREVPIAIDLGLGEGRCEYLGCDLSRDYIRINADYTT